MINYHGSQKAVVRVNPFVPLQTLLPLICEKCDFDPAHALLLKDSVSRYELQLDKSLTDLEIKELYVHDQSLGNFSLSVLLLYVPCYQQSLSFKSIFFIVLKQKISNFHFQRFMSIITIMKQTNLL